MERTAVSRYRRSMARGHIERLPSGSYRAIVYAGPDPLTGKERRLRQTEKTEEAAVTALGKLLQQAEAAHSPQTKATVGHLLDRYLGVAELDDSTRDTYEGYIRRTIKPALGEVTLRKLRGPTLDTLYARLRKCRRLCDGRPFVEHAAEGVHECAAAGCSAHECQPLAVSTIRQIHAILSGAFNAAVRWGWIDRSPAESAKLPKARQRPPSVPSPDEVGKLLAAAWETNPALAVYLWLAATTGARRGELCGLRWNRVDLESGVLHVARNYLVRGGRRIEKDTKTHQERTLVVDGVTRDLLAEHKERCRAALSPVRVELPPAAFVFSNDGGTTAWNPDWTTHQVLNLAEDLGLSVNIKALRHYTATQLLAAGIDLRNTAARLGHGGGGATTLRVYAHPVESVDHRAAELLAQQLTEQRHRT